MDRPFSRRVCIGNYIVLVSSGPRLSTRYFDQTIWPWVENICWDANSIGTFPAERMRLGGNGRAANGVGPAPGENFGSGGENYRKTNPSVRYLYEVRENFNRVCVCRTRVCVSWIRKRDAWPIRRENFLGGHGCSTSLPTWERISTRSCSMHAPNLNMLHACVTGASLHDERGQYRSADIRAV